MATLTQAEIERAGYKLEAAPPDAWREDDACSPVPGFFEFDWLSARYPDLYHKFALTSVGLVRKLRTLIDLTGLDVIDIGAGTRRSALSAAQEARTVIAVDAYASVVSFGKAAVERAGLGNVHYLRADRAHLPLADSSVDAAICSWAMMDPPEAYRVLRPGGYLIVLGPAPGALCGELTATLADVYPSLITAVAPADQYDPSCPESDVVIRADTWNGVPITGPVRLHEFTCVADYVDQTEAAAILGRLYGPRARRYMIDRQQSTLSWRLRIDISRVRK